VRYSALQCVAVRCSALQRVEVLAVRCSALQYGVLFFYIAGGGPAWGI